MGVQKRIRTRPVNDDVLKKQIGNNLRLILEDTGLSHASFADKLGVTRRTLQNWLGGVAYPQGDGVIALGHMGYNINFLYLGIGSIRRPEPSRPTRTEQEHSKTG